MESRAGSGVGAGVEGRVSSQYGVPEGWPGMLLGMAGERLGVGGWYRCCGVDGGPSMVVVLGIKLWAIILDCMEQRGQVCVLWSKARWWRGGVDGW